MALEVEPDRFTVELRPPVRFVTPTNVDEILRWAVFLDQGDSRSHIRQQSVAALLDAADHDEKMLRAAWDSGVRAVELGSLTRSVVDLVRAALDEIRKEAADRSRPVARLKP
jgi:integrase